MFLTDEGIGEKINESCAALRSGGFWLAEFFSTALYFCILRFSNLAHHKKRTPKDTMDYSSLCCRLTFCRDGMRCT